VLRFVDRWLAGDPSATASDPSFGALRTQVSSTHDVEPHVRHMLLAVINTIAELAYPDATQIAGPCMAYGAYLETVGRLPLATDVYKTMAEALDPAMPQERSAHTSVAVDIASATAAAAARVQHGYAARRVGEFTAARLSYERAITIGSEIGDHAVVLRARVGLAMVHKTRGEVAQAEALLDQTLIEASVLLAAESIATTLRDEVNRIVWLAQQARGSVRQARGRYVDAIGDYFTALMGAHDRAHHELLLGDLAACAVEAGYRKTARDAYATLARRAHAPVVRSSALVHLLELVVLDGDRLAFEDVRAELKTFEATYGMPAEHAAYAVLYEAYGAEQFKSRAAAKTALRTAAGRARALGVHAVARRAEIRLRALTSADVVSEELVADAAPCVRDLPDSLQPIANALAEMSVVA
jgi:tetratricopeptide (TPR) repeat protein